MVSVSCFGVRVSVTFHFMFVHYTFSSVWVAEWPPFGKKLPARLAIYSHCILSICNTYLFTVLVLIAGFVFCLLQFLFIVFLLLLVTESMLIFMGPLPVFREYVSPSGFLVPSLLSMKTKLKWIYKNPSKCQLIQVTGPMNRISANNRW